MLYFNVRINTYHLQITDIGIYILNNVFHKDYPQGRFGLYTLFGASVFETKKKIKALFKKKVTKKKK